MVNTRGSVVSKSSRSSIYRPVSRQSASKDYNFDTYVKEPPKTSRGKRRKKPKLSDSKTNVDNGKAVKYLDRLLLS